jgi:hypothetical protein
MMTSKFWWTLTLFVNFLVVTNTFECSELTKHELCDDDSTFDEDFGNTTTSVVLLSRQKRNFGGKEAIDFPKALNAVFGATGWLTQGLEAFSDINFHLLGYTALGMFFSCSSLDSFCGRNINLHCHLMC